MLIYYGKNLKAGNQRKKSRETLPKIGNGYHYFIDNRNQEDNDINDLHIDENLLERVSSNYVLVIYDIDTNKFYYYEVDT